MKKLLIHVGPHKTGSTTIQSFLHKKKGILLNNFYYHYPSIIEERNQHSDVAFSIKKNDFFHDDFLNKINNMDESIIISGEEFSTLNEQQIKYLIDKLNTFENIEFIWVHRKLKDWTRSIMFHSIFYDINNIIWINNLKDYISLQVQDYQAKFNIFNKFKLIKIDYEQIAGDNFIKEFFRKICINFNEDIIIWENNSNNHMNNSEMHSNNLKKFYKDNFNLDIEITLPSNFGQLLLNKINCSIDSYWHSDWNKIDEQIFTK